MTAISAASLMKKKFKLMQWQGEWKEAFGLPETTGVWFVWGGSGNGKTTFTLQLVKALLRSNRALVNSLEEGNKNSMKNALMAVNYNSKELNKVLICREPMLEFTQRLAQPRAPKVAVIDSVQMTGWAFEDYVNFKNANTDKLLVFVSQAERGKPIGKLAERIRFDADQKILVEGYRAISNGRSNPGGIYTIWEQGAANYWGGGSTEFKQSLKNTNTNTNEN
jgi:hypothetical protein